MAKHKDENEDQRIEQVSELRRASTDSDRLWTSWALASWSFRSRAGSCSEDAFSWETTRSFIARRATTTFGWTGGLEPETDGPSARRESGQSIRDPGPPPILSRNLSTRP